MSHAEAYERAWGKTQPSQDGSRQASLIYKPDGTPYHKPLQSEAQVEPSDLTWAGHQPDFYDRLRNIRTPGDVYQDVKQNVKNLGQKVGRGRDALSAAWKNLIGSRNKATVRPAHHDPDHPDNDPFWLHHEDEPQESVDARHRASGKFIPGGGGYPVITPPDTDIEVNTHTTPELGSPEAQAAWAAQYRTPAQSNHQQPTT